MSNEPILEVRNLTTVLDLSVGAVPVVDDVSFSVAEGETIGIVGESGSGKSMTALSIMQVLPKHIGRISEGSIVYKGENLIGKSPKEMSLIRGREIGMILQDPHTSLNPVLTIGSQVLEAFKINEPAATRSSLLQKTINALKKVNVADAERRVNAYAHQMSGGMKQRVVGAIAIAGAPKIIIADEPTTALDVTIQLQYLELLQDIQRENGTSIIFITHDLGIVAKLCHKIIVMYAGKIVEAGPIRDVFNSPSHPYTRALFKSVPSIDSTVDRLYAIKGQPPPLLANKVGCSFAPRCPHASVQCQEHQPPKTNGLSQSEGHVAYCWHVGDQ